MYQLMLVYSFTSC